MKICVALFILSFAYGLGAEAKTCNWSGGEDVYKDVKFDLSATQKTLEISKNVREELNINGSWKLKREFKSKDGSSWLEFRFPKDKAIKGIVEPQLLKAKGRGVIKFWYDNGDGFLASVFTCS